MPWEAHEQHEKVKRQAPERWAPRPEGAQPASGENWGTFSWVFIGVVHWNLLQDTLREKEIDAFENWSIYIVYRVWAYKYINIHIHIFIVQIDSLKVMRNTIIKTCVWLV